MKRRSIRTFLPDEIPQSHLQQLLEALRWAPSAGNRQPWHFFIVHNAILKSQLSKAAYNQNFLVQAPVVLAVCALCEESAARYGSRGRDLYVYQDTAAAIQNLLLVATDLGYGTCWVGAFDEKEVSIVLDLPSEMRPVALIPVGKPGQDPSARPRFPVNQITTILE